MIHDPLTKLQCSPTSDGSACAIVASERYVEEHGLGDRAIEIAGQSMVTDLSSTFAEDTDCMKIVGSDMSKQAAEEAYAEAGIAAERGRRLRAARLLQRQRADHLRSARLRGRGRGAQAGRGRGDHLRRQGRRQPLRRADLQGTPAGRDRAGAVLGADLAAARGSRQAAGRGRQDRSAAQHRPRRRRRGHRLQAGGLGGRTGGRRARWRREAVPIRQGRGDHRGRPGDRQDDRAGAGPQGLPGRDRRPRPRARPSRRRPSWAAARSRSQLNVTDRDSFTAFLDEAERQLGPVDVLINNAGIMPVTPFERRERRVDPPPARHQRLRRHGRHPAGDAADESRGGAATSSTSPPRPAKRACPGSPPTRRPSTRSSG